MLCYHGTTEQSYKAIMAGESKITGPWTVSDMDSCMYFWPIDKSEGDDDDELSEYCIRMGFESAQVQAAVKGDNTKLYVIACEIPDELLEDDFSCENMSDSASYILCSQFSKDMIVKTLVCDFNQWHSPFIISGLLDNPNFNHYSIEPELLTISESLKGSEVYLDEILEFDYTEA